MDSVGLTAQKDIVEEVYGFIRVYSDGSVDRPDFGGFVPASPEGFVHGVATKDVTVDAQTGVWARIFLPQCVVSSNRKAPIVLHFHPGALCMGTPSASAFHAFCSKMASQSASIWVSVDYRLAPEHRLPAAYDDAYASFLWLHAQSSFICEDGTSHAQDPYASVRGRGLPCLDGLCCPVHKHSHGDDGSLHGCDSGGHGQASGLAAIAPPDAHRSRLDPWLGAHADFSNCFLAGESSGAAIVHYLAMRIIQEDQGCGRIRIRGLVMIHPAFLIEGIMDTSFDPTKEKRPGTLRRLCLPVGAELDHPLVNPLHAQAPKLTDVVMPPIVIAVADQDKLCAPAVHYHDAMKQYGHRIERHVTEGKGHCFYLRDSKSKESELLTQHLISFLCNNTQRD